MAFLMRWHFDREPEYSVNKRTRPIDPRYIVITFELNNNRTPIECPRGGNQSLLVLSNCFEKRMSEQSRSEDVRKKPTSAHNKNEDVRMTSSEIEGVGQQSIHLEILSPSSRSRGRTSSAQNFFRGKAE